MAKVKVQVLGGTEQEKDANTIGELKKSMSLDNFQASVNGEPVADNHTLGQWDFVAFTQQVKGGYVLDNTVLF